MVSEPNAIGVQLEDASHDRGLVGVGAPERVEALANGGGRVVLVGAGPGDPELITVRGLAWLRRAEVLVYDQLVSAELAEAPADCLRVFAGKSPGRHCVAQPAINAMLVRHARAGRLVGTAQGR